MRIRSRVLFGPVLSRCLCAAFALTLAAALPAGAEPPQNDASAEQRRDAEVEAVGRDLEELKQRVEELEATEIANEAATRSIIRQAMTTVGAKINEFVSFGGVFEFGPTWGKDFQGTAFRTLQIPTAQLAFDIQVNPWTLGSFIIEYDDGGSNLFPTTSGFQLSIDRINIDTATVTLGNTQRFPPYGVFGRMIVPFGISTGNPVADVLSLNDPLTIEVFEAKEDAILMGFEFPTRPLTPSIPIPSPPKVKPLLLNPLVSAISKRLGYKPFPPPPPVQTYVTLPPRPPPFSAGVYLFDGDTRRRFPKKKWNIGDQIGAWVGYRTRVYCRNYGQQGPADEPRLSWVHIFCPWSLEFDVDYMSSVFDSRFLGFEFRTLLEQIAFVPGMAASVKAILGPVSLVAEWNGAIDNATFVIDLVNYSITPRAWQVSLGYQFDWNPAVAVIGAEGTYASIGYSQSKDLAGVGPNRIGSVPERRLLVTLGEWVLPGVRVAFEYAFIMDYPRRLGGTGRNASGFTGLLTYEW